jgi:hypothetical protein
VVKVGDVQPDQLAGTDLLLVGGPTHGSRPSPAMHEFLSHIPRDGAGGQAAGRLHRQGHRRAPGGRRA